MRSRRLASLFPRSMLLSGLLLLAVVFPGRAVLAPEAAGNLEVDRRGAASVAEKSYQAPALLESESWKGFLNRNPGWIARWDASSGTPERLQGPPRAIPGFGSIDGTNAEAAARSLLRREGAEWIDVDELILARLVEDRTGFWVHFRQEKDGVPVWNGRVSLRLTRQGEVVEWTNRHLRDSPRPPSLKLSSSAGLEAAREGLPGPPAPVQEGELCWLPAARDGEARMVWRFEFLTADPPGRWFSFVDAETSLLLWRWNGVDYAEVTGEVTGGVEPVTADDNFESRPLPHLGVILEEPGQPQQAGVTDAEGGFALSSVGTSGRTVTAALAGPFGVVIDLDDGLTPEVTGAVPEGEPATVHLDFDDNVSEANERDAYYHVMVAHDFIQALDSSFNALDYPMPLALDVNGRCNAYWDGLGLNFYREGGGCECFARIATVVYHEYGHGITSAVYWPFYYPSGAMSEGFSDYYGSAITDQPFTGIDYRGPGTYIRRIDEDRVYPQDWIGESHYDGLIIASALWDMREALGASWADTLFHFARYGHADNFDDYFMDILIEDDDNSTIYDGTPHLSTLADIFSAHGIGDYNIHVSHLPMPDSEDILGTHTIQASFLSIYSLAPDSVQIHMTVQNGSTMSEINQVMTPTGNVREYEAVLDPVPAGTEVSYYFTAADVSGHTLTYPEGGAGDPFVFRVGPDATPPWIDHQPLADLPADMPKLRVYTRAGDNLELPLHSLQLVWRTNQGSPSTRDMTLLSGSEYLAEVPPNGFVVGNTIDYRIEAIDGSVAENVTVDPSAGWHSFRLVKGFLRDFEANDGGLTGDHDWEWGVPSGPIGPHSGSKVWATSLNGGYGNQTISRLALPPVDLSTWDRACLGFQQAYLTEVDYDGVFVEVSTDGGAHWSLLLPDGGYNTAAIGATGAPAFSGGDGEWHEVLFDLFPYLGSSDCRLRLVLATDQGVVQRGWVVDDLMVARRQIHGRPLSLRAVSGLNEQVSMKWAPPAGLPESGSPVMGYNVYRTEAVAPGDPLLLTPSPVSGLSYMDDDVINGTVYDYFVAAVYEDGESPLTGPVEGWPYQAEIAVDPLSVSTSVDTADVRAESIEISNTGTGLLEVEVYPANPGQSLDDVRILIPLTTEGKRGPATPAKAAGPAAPAKTAGSVRSYEPEALQSGIREAAERWRASGKALPHLSHGDLKSAKTVWDTLIVDGDDPPEITPDLALVEAQQTADFLTLRLTAHEPWGDPQTEFTFFVSLDTDRNRTTGYGGAEYLVLVGAFCYGTFGIPGIILDTQFNAVAILFPPGLESGGVSTELAFPKAAIGDPAQVAVTVYAMDPAANEVRDAVPDFVFLPWLLLQTPHVTADTETPAVLDFQVTGSGVEVGSHSGLLLLESNDPLNPEMSVPVTCVVTGDTPVFLSGFSAEPLEEGVALSWRVNASAGTAGFLLYRREVSIASAGEELISDEPILPESDGSYGYLDDTVRPDTEYQYRLAALTPGGAEISAGTLSVTTKPQAAPAALWLARPVPNPSRGGVLLRYGLPGPGAVKLLLLSPDGRRVATLAETSHARAGYFSVPWDGRDERGRAVAAGSYFVLLEGAGRRVTEKLMVVR